MSRLCQLRRNAGAGQIQFLGTAIILALGMASCVGRAVETQAYRDANRKEKNSHTYYLNRGGSDDSVRHLSISGWQDRNRL